VVVVVKLQRPGLGKLFDVDLGTLKFCKYVHGDALQHFGNSGMSPTELQVHRATLHTGEEVVVKIQRPGLRKLFDIDLANMKQLAALLDKTDPNRDTMGVYEESRATLYQEIDYIQEGKHCDRWGSLAVSVSLSSPIFIQEGKHCDRWGSLAVSFSLSSPIFKRRGGWEGWGARGRRGGGEGLPWRHRAHLREESRQAPSEE